MRARPLLAAVAAGLVSLSAASAEEGKPRSVNSTEKHGAPSLTAVAVAEPPARTEAASAGTDSSAPAKPAASPVPRTTASEPSKAEAPRKPLAPTLIVKINLSSQSMSLAYDGKPQETWKISSGREGYATPRGTFRPQWASRMWYSRKYDNAPMPHAVFFVGGVAVHGTQAVRSLGMPASHGCVRLAPSNAARFYSLVHKHGYARTRIEVFGTPPATRIARSRDLQRTRETSVGLRPALDPRRVPPQRMVSSGGGIGAFGWAGSKPAVQLQRQPNGVIYLPPNSRYRGQETFVYNGVVYRRIR